MASPLITKTPRYTSCIRCMIPPGSFSSPLAGQQIRGKKKLAKVSTITVQLLQNVPGYGRRGQVLPISPGVMRNIWYPKKIAGYVTIAKLQTLGKKDATVERDPTFGSRKQRESVKKAQKARTLPVKKNMSAQVRAPALEEAVNESQTIEIELLTPEEATDVMDKLLPPSIDFYRTAITTSLPPKRVSPSIPAGRVLSQAAEAAAVERAAKEKMSKVSERVGIFGSVSTSDIAANLKAILAEDSTGQRIVFSHENISFIEETGEKDRIKHLGSFDMRIKLDMARGSIRRTINVKAQE